MGCKVVVIYSQPSFRFLSSLSLKRDKKEIIGVYANFMIVLFANLKIIITFVPKFKKYDRKH